MARLAPNGGPLGSRAILEIIARYRAFTEVEHVKFTAIVTCHNSDPNPIVNMLLSQTRPPDDIMLECSGDCRELLHEIVHYLSVPDDKDFGYRKRNRMSSLAAGDWIGFFCHDDSYHPRYLEFMLRLAEGVDVVYSDWNDIPGCTFRSSSSTLGNFIVRKEVFLKAGGFPIMDDMGLSDAALINALVDAGVSLAKNKYPMYYHNIPYSDTINPTVWGEQHRYSDWIKDRVTYAAWKYLTDIMLKDI